MTSTDEHARTPLKRLKYNNSDATPRSSLLFAAQMSEIRKKRGSSARKKHNESSGYKMLPAYRSLGDCGCVQRPKVNPFNEGLIQRLTEPTCSPDLFANVVSPSEVNEFGWTIEDISKIRPADIGTPTSPVEEYIDEQTESEAQEAIEQYFSMTHNVTSPVGEVGTWVSFCSEVTPVSGGRPNPNHAVSTPCTRQPTKKSFMNSVGVQTMLTLPEKLPEEVLSVLRPYFNESIEDCSMSENCNTSSLRRKLFFNQEEISPVKFNSSKGALEGVKPHQWTPVKDGTCEEVGSPDLSPIKVEDVPWNFNKDGVFMHEAGDFVDREKSALEIFSSTRAVVRQCSSSASSSIQSSHSLPAILVTPLATSSTAMSQDTGFVSAGDARSPLSHDEELSLNQKWWAEAQARKKAPPVVMGEHHIIASAKQGGTTTSSVGDRIIASDKKDVTIPSAITSVAPEITSSPWVDKIVSWLPMKKIASSPQST